MVIGCGGPGMSVGRSLAQDYPLFMTDIDQGRLDDAFAALRDEGYIASSAACDTTDIEQTEAQLQVRAKASALSKAASTMSR